MSILVHFSFSPFLQQLHIFKLLHSFTSALSSISLPECEELCNAAWSTKKRERSYINWIEHIHIGFLESIGRKAVLLCVEIIFLCSLGICRIFQVQDYNNKHRGRIFVNKINLQQKKKIQDTDRQASG